MFFPFFATMMLAIESQKVIEMRLVRIAWGGREASAELSSMIAEKVSATWEATGTLMTGGSPDVVIARYREHVAANTVRLSTT